MPVLGSNRSRLLKNQTEKSMEYKMETRVVNWLWAVALVFLYDHGAGDLQFRVSCLELVQDPNKGLYNRCYVEFRLRCHKRA